MSIPRRTFLAASAASVAALAPSASRAAGCCSAQATSAPAGKATAKLQLSSQLGVIPVKDVPGKLALMEKWGFDAVELPGDVADKKQLYLDALRNSKLKPSAVCFGSMKGDLVSEDKQKRGPAADLLKRVLAAAGELKSTGVIYVPAFNGQTKLTNQEIRQILLDTLPAIGEFAVQAGTRLLLEPLNRKEAYFLRQLADGASICRDCNSPGICMMGDFYHMAIEETSAQGAFISAGKYLHHVHLASKTRVLPGQDPQDEAFYRDGFVGLKAIGYQDYCSYECSVRGDRQVEIPKSMAWLRDQWQRAGSCEA